MPKTRDLIRATLILASHYHGIEEHEIVVSSWALEGDDNIHVGLAHPDDSDIETPTCSAATFDEAVKELAEYYNDKIRVRAQRDLEVARSYTEPVT